MHLQLFTALLFFIKNIADSHKRVFIFSYYDEIVV